MWGGETQDPSGRETWEIQEMAYRYDHVNGKWNSFKTNGPCPAGIVRGAATSVGHYLYIYGGKDRGDTSSGSLHQLDIHTHTWTLLFAHRCTSNGPKMKFDCGMVSHRDRLVVFGGHCDERRGETNELHIFDLETSE